MTSISRVVAGLGGDRIDTRAELQDAIGQQRQDQQRDRNDEPQRVDARTSSICSMIGGCCRLEAPSAKDAAGLPKRPPPKQATAPKRRQRCQYSLHHPLHSRFDARHASTWPTAGRNPERPFAGSNHTLFPTARKEGGVVVRHFCARCARCAGKTTDECPAQARSHRRMTLHGRTVRPYSPSNSTTKPRMPAGRATHLSYSCHVCGGKRRDSYWSLHETRPF